MNQCASFGRVSISVAAVLVFVSAYAAWAFPPEKPYDPRPLMAAAEKKVTGDKYTFIVMGGVKGGGGFGPLVKHAETLNPALALLTGDMVAAGAPQPYDVLEKQMGELARKVPCWPCLGNHELGGQGLGPYAKFWGIHTRHYSFDFKNAKFICLDAPGRQPGGGELKWAEAQLTEGQRAGKLLFVLQHVPCYTVGMASNGEVPGKPTGLTELCKKYGVIVDFAGHDHIYYRTFRDGVTYVVQGMGGAALYSGRRGGEAVDGDVYVVASEKGNVLIHKPDGEKTVKATYLLTAITVDGNSVTGKTMTAAGKVFDDFTLAPTPVIKPDSIKKP